jgi:pseudouridine synthase
MAKKSEETGAAKRKAAAPDAELSPESAPKARKSRAKSKEPEAEAKPARMSAAAKKARSAGKAKTPAAKTRKAKVTIKDATGEPLEVPVDLSGAVDDPIGDVSSGEARFFLGDAAEPVAQAEMAAYRADTADDALEGTLQRDPDPPAGAVHVKQKRAGPSPDAESGKGGVVPDPEASSAPTESEKDESPETSADSASSPKLARLQKILSQAGIASRRHAEEMIEAGRVMVNGQVITQLGAKADPTRDHIRVDGKLIAGAERHRYFVLNKPKGFVTTVSDPEGRPTVMQFFSRMHERLYPVGRLDYESEGLLLVTNDGELANQLTKAASGIEKTYLVKVSGHPSEQELDLLRSGVPIEREGPGSRKVHTAPAQIRRVREGDNPWFEVVLIEGRNRELRKMFQSIGHFVEKIRRVGYGPLVLDQEPGKLRELEPEELSLLRLAAEGKWKPKRPHAAKMLPKQAGRPPQRSEVRDARGKWKPERGGAGGFDPRRTGQRPFQKSPGQGPARSEKPFREKREWQPREPRFGANREEPRGGKPGFGRPQSERFGGRSGFGRHDRPRPAGDAGRFGPRSGEQRPFRGRPDTGAGPVAGPGARPEIRRFAPRPQQPRVPDARPPRFQVEEVRPRTWNKPPAAGRYTERPDFKRPNDQNRRFDKPQGKSFGEKRGDHFEGRPPRKFGSGPKPGSGQGFKSGFQRGSEGRAKPAFGSEDRGATPGPRGFAPGRFSKPGGKAFGGRGPGFKGKPGAPKRSGSRPGGKPPGGRKRG